MAQASVSKKKAVKALKEVHHPLMASIHSCMFLTKTIE